MDLIRAIAIWPRLSCTSLTASALIMDVKVLTTDGSAVDSTTHVRTATMHWQIKRSRRGPEANGTPWR
jgi:hypothetical protein